MRQPAFDDALTGLPNRRPLAQRPGLGSGTPRCTVCTAHIGQRLFRGDAEAPQPLIADAVQAACRLATHSGPAGDVGDVGDVGEGAEGGEGGDRAGLWHRTHPGGNAQPGCKAAGRCRRQSWP